MIIDSINDTIDKNMAVMLYFTGKDCGVCNALKPKIKECFDTNFSDIKQIYIDTNSNQEVAASFNVFAVPTLLVFLDKKEFIRKSRNLSIELLIEEIKRPYQMMMS